MSIALCRMVDVDVGSASNADLLIYSLTEEHRGNFILNAIGESIVERWAVLQSDSILDIDQKPALSNKAVRCDGLVSSVDAWVRSCVTLRPWIAIDISCMSRPTMATVIQAIFEAARHKPLRLSVIYVLADYTAPPDQLPPNEDIRPISAWFSGWPSDATAGTSLIVGIGYERYKAEGACEYFDAGEAIVFNPKSPIIDYEQQVERNNQDLLARALRRNRLISYQVDKPTETFGQLVSEVMNFLPRMNPVLLPFGPKIFFILNLMLAAVYREIGVWHVTGDVNTNYTPHTASDYKVSFQIDLNPNVDIN